MTHEPAPDDADAVPGPAAVFEVLSASTALVDRTPAAAGHRAAPSFLHHLGHRLLGGRGAIVDALCHAWSNPPRSASRA